MSGPEPLLYSAALLQLACAALCGIGWYFGIRIDRLLPALLAGGILGVVAYCGPRVAGVISWGESPWDLLEMELARGPARFLCFASMVSVLAIVAVIHRYWPEWTSDLAENAADEIQLNVRIRHWFRAVFSLTPPPILSASSPEFRPEQSPQLKNPASHDPPVAP